MNRRANILVLSLIVVVVGAALIFAFTKGSGPTDTCQSVHQVTHTITISSNIARPAHITGQLCDKLRFVNHDPVMQEIAFGPHAHHVSYNGVTENILNQGQSFTSTLNMSGSYLWHDHWHDVIHGSFTVNH